MAEVDEEVEQLKRRVALLETQIENIFTRLLTVSNAMEAVRTQNQRHEERLMRGVR